MLYRTSNIFRTSNSYLAPAESYIVNVVEPGAIINETGTDTTFTVHPGHGFATGDKWLINTDSSSYSGINTVTSVTSTTITLPITLTLSSGDVLVNLGPDTGIAQPNWDGGGVTVYSDPSGSTTITRSELTCGTGGDYAYYHTGNLSFWEVVRSTTGTPSSIILNAYQSTTPQVVNSIRYAHLFATSGTGTVADPWVVAGSNCLQAAYNDLPQGVGGGGIIRAIPGVYDLGTNDGALTIGSATENLEGVTIEGYGKGTTESDSYDGGAIFVYRGSGSAFKLGDFTAANKTLAFCTLRNFKLLQGGTDGTGTGILARLFRRNLIEDVLVEDFSIGCALVSISDFNTFRRFYARDCQAYGVYVGYTTGMLTPNGQCNGNVFEECDIMNLGRDYGWSNYGIFIDSDSVNCVIKNGRFHNFDTSGFAAIICKHSNGLTVDSNYFEGHYYTCWIQNAGSDTFYGYRFTNNYVTQIDNAGGSGNIGFRTNCPSGTISDVVVTGNHFTNPSILAPYDTGTAITIHANTRNVHIGPNAYVNMNTANVTIGGAAVTYFREDDGSLTFTGNATMLTSNAGQWIKGQTSELLTLSTGGTTTDTTANLLPANSVIEAVTCRVTTTITTATDWSVGDPTTATRFSSANSTLTAGTTSVGLNHRKGAVSTDATGPTQISAAKVRITTTGTPGAGAIRITVFYQQFIAPTS